MNEEKFFIVRWGRFVAIGDDFFSKPTATDGRVPVQERICEFPERIVIVGSGHLHPKFRRGYKAEFRMRFAK